MALTASKIRAQVTADTDEAERKMKGFGQTVSNTARTSGRDLGGLGDAFGGLGVDIARFAGPAGVGLAVAGMARAAVSMDDLRQKAENTERQLIAFAGGSRQAQTATDALVRATDGGVNRMSAMAQASQLLGMGLAKTSDQVYDLSRMATMLGDKTMTVEERMASFNAMLANQSIERLDTFGISSGRVRQRITEQQAATAGLSREQAFVNAVLEIGGEKLRAVEAAGVVAASATDQLSSAFADLKLEVAAFVNLEGGIRGVGSALRDVAETLGTFNDLRAADPEERLTGLQTKLANLKQTLADLQSGQGFEAFAGRLLGTTAVDAAALQLAIQNVERAIASLQGQTTQWGDAGAHAGGRAQTAAEYAQAAVSGVHTELSRLDVWGDWAAAAERAAISTANAVRATQGAVTGTFTQPSKTRWGLYGEWGQHFTEPTTAEDPVKAWLARMEAANRQITTNARTGMTSSLRSAADDFERRFKGALEQGQRFSIGLRDFRPGGDKGPNAPGMNGAYEDIYRLQAWLTDGSWSETAAKYGLDRAGAQDRVSKFQSGMWDASVMELIDAGKITEQIRQAQLGQQVMDAVAADFARAAGADAKTVKALLGISDTGGVDVGTLDLGGKLVPALTSAIDAELTAKGQDLNKRGAVAWRLVEEGMLMEAGRSVRFAAMVDAMIDNSLARYIPNAGAQNSARMQGVPGM